MEERAAKIVEACLKETSKNPIEIFRNITQMDFVRMHGPEHHILDGGALLTAFYNAGGNIDLEKSLEELMSRGIKMPAGMCGMWGVCGAVTSVGAALSIIAKANPDKVEEPWGTNMECTSMAVAKLGEIGGPRCCKRNGYLSFKEAIEFVNKYYDVTLDYEEIKCIHSHINVQCIKERCPFYNG